MHILLSCHLLGCQPLLSFSPSLSHLFLRWVFPLWNTLLNQVTWLLLCYSWWGSHTIPEYLLSGLLPPLLRQIRDNALLVLTFHFTMRPNTNTLYSVWVSQSPKDEHWFFQIQVTTPSLSHTHQSTRGLTLFVHPFDPSCSSHLIIQTDHPTLPASNQPIFLVNLVQFSHTFSLHFYLSTSFSPIWFHPPIFCLFLCTHLSHISLQFKAAYPTWLHLLIWFLIVSKALSHFLSIYRLSHLYTLIPEVKSWSKMPTICFASTDAAWSILSAICFAVVCYCEASPRIYHIETFAARILQGVQLIVRNLVFHLLITLSIC